MYRGFALRIHAPQHELASAKMLIIADCNDPPIEVAERVFGGDITALGVFVSIDAGLRDIAEEIRRRQTRNRDDAAEIAACDAELERTAVWEHEARWQQLCVELAAVTAALTVVETPTAVEPAMDDTPSSGLPGTTDLVSDAAIAAAEQAVADRADDPAWRIVTTPIEHCIPAAVASLELLRTFAADGAAAKQEQDSYTMDDDAEAADAAADQDEAEVVVLELPQPALRTRTRLVFGDTTTLLQLHAQRAAKARGGTVARTGASDQLDLFATLELPMGRVPEWQKELVAIGVEQLALF
jgi:hypothetical protein